MTISTTTSRVSFAGNASTVNFATGFKFFAATDLTVIIVTDSTGAEAIKTLTTHYSVAGAGSDSGGTVTMGVAPAVGQTIVIVRTQPHTQGLDLVENDPFPSDSVEETLDKIVVMTQQNDDALLRSVRKAEGFTETFDPTLPKIITGSTVLAFNSAATAFEIGPTTTAISGAAASATAAATSATASASSATAGASSATASASSATASASSATAAAASATSIGLTTRGDLLKRGASANERLAIGSANTVLTTNGTDPAWSTITNAMLAGSIDLASKVTGALPVANGGSGATSLTDGGILLGSGTGAVTALAALAKGSIVAGDGATDPVALAVGSNTTVLTANSATASGLAWAASAAGGKILQVVTAHLNTYASHSATNVDAPAEILTAAITPGATSSKILVFGHVSGSSTNSDVQYLGTQLKRDSTLIGEANNAAWNTGTGESHTNVSLSGDYSKTSSIPFHFVDAPSSTSALTYKIFAFANHFGSSLSDSVFIQNGGGYSYNNKEAGMGTTSLTLMEIGA